MFQLGQRWQQVVIGRRQQCRRVGSSSSAGGSSGGSGVAAAKAATAKNKIAPTSIPQTTPLKTKPPTGKTFVFLKCSDVNQCAGRG